MHLNILASIHAEMDNDIDHNHRQTLISAAGVLTLHDYGLKNVF